MLARIIRHEWTLLVADRTAVLIVVMFTALIGAAAISGLRAVRTTDQTVTAVLTAQDDRLRDARDTLTGPGASGDATWGPASPAWLGGFVGRYLAQPTAPLAALATGQTDLNAPYARVTARGREAIAPPMQTGNPLLLHLGQFDLAFVLVYLYPLFVLALAYDLTSTEREDGTLRLIASQPVTLRQVVIGKLMARGVVVLLPALLAPCVVLPFDGTPLDGAGMLRVLVWTVAVVAYGLVWFALAVIVNARGRTPAFNALALAGAWLALVVIVPAVLNVLVERWYPVPSRVEFVNAARQASNQARVESSRVLGRFIEEHPEFAVAGDGMKNAAVLTAARDDEISREMLPVLERFERQRARQHDAVRWLRVASPAALLQGVLVDAAGTGVDRHRHFTAQVDHFHQVWRRHFQPLLFTDAALTRGDYDGLPTFTYAEEPIGVLVWRLLGAVVVLVALGGVGLIAGLTTYRRYALID